VNPPPTSERNQPRIHDHETLRLIGRGAYGEVWLARGVTGVLRAVKVVWRADYDYPEAFEREFEAIKKFEPVSRRHPGLVSILQVGRNDEEGFYYYVMELADDVDAGRDIVPETYRPLTLMALMRKEGRLKAAECLKHGETIADALHFMHENGLIHRDIKPSNLIFSDGECRLVDIGLVALLGQRSFVGTEGFVAPEGPGTAEADIFSLGMVLYEASTGKDRLDFPDLPSAHESGEKIEQWRLLHRVICRACAQHATDRYVTAHDMALALRGEKVPVRGSRRKFMILAGALGLLLTGVVVGLSQQEKITAALHHTEPLLTIMTEPTGAEVYSNGQMLGTTPLNFNPREGVPAIYRVRMTGYRNQEIEYTGNKKKPARYELKLEQSRLPQPGERWSNSIKLPFVPKQGGHVSERPVQMKFFDAFIKAEERPFEGRVVRYQVRGDKESAYIVVVPPADAEAFRHWMTEKDRERGFLTSEHRYELEPFSYADAAVGDAEPVPSAADGDSSREWQAFSLRVERQGYGSVMVRSNPAGVKVFHREELLGITPLEIPRIKTGEVEYDLRAEGFTDLILEGTVAENAMLELFADMQARRNVTYGREWRNSMGMLFLPLGDILMGAHETRRRDYMEYAKEANARRPMNFSEQVKAGAVPVVGVDRVEARGFCDWLTKRDRELGLIGKTDRYRLPTDEEWSRAVGLPLERGKDPAERNGRIRGVYPWGYEWPPPKGIDNFADASGSVSQGLQAIITNYEDNFSALAGVMATRPSKKGYFGLAGNVSEWVDSDYVAANGKTTDKAASMGTVRGGNWRSANADELLSSARMALPVDTKRDSIGFRIVLAKE
jgi:serine/threonine protein kinase/formylglycine-generating enzyme required for sulfatase activity